LLQLILTGHGAETLLLALSQHCQDAFVLPLQLVSAVIYLVHTLILTHLVNASTTQKTA
jgi:hypothetical protein